MTAKISILGFLVWTMVPCAWGDAWQPSGKTKIFLNQEGITATVIPLKVEQKQQRVVLIVDGTNTEIDGEPRLLTVKERGKRADFVREVNGKEYISMTSSQIWSNSRSYSLQVPGRRGSVDVYYHPKQSAAANQESARQAVNRMIYRRDKPATEDKNTLGTKEESRLKDIASSTNEACGTSISASIELASFGENILKEMDVAEACGVSLNAIKELCQEEMGKEAVQKKIKTLTCRLDKKPSLQLREGKLVYATTAWSAHQRDLAKEWLEEKL